LTSARACSSEKGMTAAISQPYPTNTEKYKTWDKKLR
jgi:hypothetical protein